MIKQSTMTNCNLHLLKSLLTFFILLFFLNVYSQTWTGITSQDWHTASNWDNNLVPGAADEVIIPNVLNFDPVITGTASCLSLIVELSGTLVVEVGAMLTIDGSLGHAAIIEGTLTNKGTMNIGLIQGFEENGLNNSGEVLNEGTINIGKTNIQDFYCLANINVFTNAASGLIEIIQSDGGGLLNTSGETPAGPKTGNFNNNGIINIGKNNTISQRGLNNIFANFHNNSGGTLCIDNANSVGLESLGTFNNGGIITIGANGPIGAEGIKFDFEFNNLTCGSIYLFKEFANGFFGAFQNNGLFSINTTETSTPGNFINDGILEDVIGIFPLGPVTNNDVIVRPLGGLFCEEFTPALIIGGANSFTIGAQWFKEMALLNVGGNYTSGTNTFLQTTFGAGSHTAYFKATDNDNNCDFTVKIGLNLEIDASDPMVNCKSATIEVDANGNATLAVNDVFDSASDNCATEAELLASGSLSESSFDCNDINNNLSVTLIVNDGNGNSGNCNAAVTVEDNLAPSFTAPNDITIFMDSNCTYDRSVIATGDVTDESDNCSMGLNATFTDSDNLNSCNSTGTITRTWSLSDDENNTATSQSQTITVIDNIAPSFTAPNDITIFMNSNCTFDRSVSTTGDVTDESDNCSMGLNATFTDSDNLNSCNGTGTITRTWSLSDDCNNSAANQTQTITVVDNIAPSFTAPNDITIYMDSGCNFDRNVNATGDVTDESENCSMVLNATFTDSDNLNSCNGTGTITRTWSLIDDCNNSAANQTQTITVVDNIAPSFTAPNDITIYMDSGCNFDRSVSATGDVTDESDNCSMGLNATFTDTDNLNSCNGTGTIVRTWSLSDDCNNSAANQTQTITVVDNIAPSFTAPNDITIFMDSNCTYDRSISATGDVTDESDNCSMGLNATFTDTDNLNSCNGTGTIMRTWSLSDDCNNSAANQTQIITVVDNITPSFTVPNDITIFMNANCTFDRNVSATGDVTDESDNCSTGLNATYSDFDNLTGNNGMGTIERTWSLSDDCNNSAAGQTQIITVVDNFKPTPFCQDLNVELDSSGLGSINSIQVDNGSFDNCSNVSLSLDMEDFNCNHTGENTVTLTVTDDFGNFDVCTAKITVEDNTKPSLSCSNVPSPINTEPGECSVYLNFPVPTANDNCEVSELLAKIQDANTNATIVNWTIDPDGQLPPGDYKIKWRAKDPTGNKRTCTKNFSIMDNEAPVARCVPSLFVQLVNGQANISVSDIDDGSTDNCGIQNLTFVLNQSLFGCENRGPGTAVLTVTDTNGNQDECTTDLTIQGTTLSITDISQNEGTAGAPYTFYFFKIERASNDCFLTIDYQTEDGTATLDDNDYVSLNGTHYFIQGGTLIRYTIVRVIKDANYESDEVFQVKLSNATPGVIFSDDTGEGHIINDDGAQAFGNEIVDGVEEAQFYNNLNPEVKEGLSIYPSLTNGELNIKAPSDWLKDGSLQTEIYDQSARKIISFPLEYKQISIDASALPGGTYQVVVYLKDGNIAIQRFVKQT